MLLAIQVLAQKKATSEVEAIKSAIEKETRAYFSIDQQSWMDSWVHAPYSYWSYADESTTNHFDGWSAIEVGFNDYFVTSKPTTISVEREWQEIRVYGTGAYARFKQYVVANGVKGPEQTEIRILEKDKTTWKIVLVAVLKKT
jgi:hypothetical protein